jgi:hypothetical protein
MQISLATRDDIPVLVKLAEDLIKTTKYSILQFSADKVEKALLGTFEQGQTKSVCLVAKKDGKIVGSIIGYKDQTPFSEDPVAFEFLWWCQPGTSKRQLLKLYEGYEYWAKNVAKCKALLVGQLHFKHAPENYWTRQNFVKCEEYYLKDLSWE